MECLVANDDDFDMRLVVTVRRGAGDTVMTIEPVTVLKAADGCLFANKRHDNGDIELFIFPLANLIEASSTRIK
jgi:hypothetical protein